MSIVILHEGSDKSKDQWDKSGSLDNWLLKKLIHIQGFDLDTKKVSFYGMGSKSNFFDPNYESYVDDLLPQVEADQIRKILFVVDADSASDDKSSGGAENSLTALKEIAAELGLDGISDFYVCCDPKTQEGNVEALLLSTLSEEKKSCIESFLECSDFKGKGNTKAVLNGVYKAAYPEAPFDFEHDSFDELKEKLRLLLS